MFVDVSAIKGTGIEELLEAGLHLVTKVRRNMKNMLLPLQDKVSRIGSIMDEMKNAVNTILMLCQRL